MIVADTNLVAYLMIRSDHTPAAEAVLRKDSDWAAPVLWRSEFRSVLALYLRRGQLAFSDAIQYLEQAEALLRGNEHHVPSVPVLDLARTSGCSAYDCEFVYLARAMALPLVTSDARVLQAFPDVAISLTDFAP